MAPKKSVCKLLNIKKFKFKLVSLDMGWERGGRLTAKINGRPETYLLWNLETKKKMMKPGLNFINVLRTAFTLADPEGIKRYWWLNCIFYTFGIYEVKAACKTLVKLTPRGNDSLRQPNLIKLLGPYLGTKPSSVNGVRHLTLKVVLDSLTVCSIN